VRGDGRGARRVSTHLPLPLMCRVSTEDARGSYGGVARSPSPARQSGGRPTCSRVPPVLLPTSQFVVCSRIGTERRSSRTSLRKFNSVAAGVVVPRRSPCRASFSAVTNRSSRVPVSPSERATSVTHDGPPSLTSSRFLTVLRYPSPQATLGGSLAD
jgi:hypothetical protein